ncbi:hypothetical protein [Hymenobacter latericus]|uniref:hypothetical protein n=1 Tax=Hymenobacter sp. YIM 151858-1 TaxID=2987688 RepID=UPI0022272FD9|nr:hypothetical protein [Hymenobacter sp. YIM 151858-1]UYZ60055.1 hypothetical protein OIS50_04465 [Hymenobacter sp. YIM 151858-1]
MKRLAYPLLLLSIALLRVPAMGQAKEGINSLPRYGGIVKSKALRQLDQEFIASALRQYNNDRRAASESCVVQGWSYFYDNNFSTSVKRFNQAWLLDSTNCNVYYGFSACLSEKGDAAGAHRYFLMAQRLDSRNQGANKYYDRLSLYYKAKKQAPRNA